MTNFDRLHALQEELRAAQDEENEAMAKLATSMRGGSTDPQIFKALMDGTVNARKKTQELYEEWKALADRFYAGTL